MAVSGVCYSGRRSIDYADLRPACTKSPSNLGPGEVELTSIGVITAEGQRVQGVLRTGIPRDRCRLPVRTRSGEVC